MSLADLGMCLADVIDCVDESVAGHHRRVAAMADALAAELELATSSREQLVLAASVHDVGALSLSERLGALYFDLAQSEHSEPGYLLLKECAPLRGIAEIIRWHHERWDDKASQPLKLPPYESRILFLCDRVAVIAGRPECGLDCIADARMLIHENAGRMFDPELVERCLRLPDSHAFWQRSSAQLNELADFAFTSSIELDWSCLEEFALTLSRLIDFRCRFTATHSRGVAACGSALAGIAGMSDDDVSLMRVAGYLHDIGKLAVPQEIIEKTGALTSDEWEKVRAHVRYSTAALWRLGSPESVQTWVAQHHERPNGCGYPFGLDGEGLDLGSRVLALADVFVALTEDRPYRAALRRLEAMEIMVGMANRGELDGELIKLLDERYEAIDAERRSAQAAAREEFEAFHVAVEASAA